MLLQEKSGTGRERFADEELQRSELKIMRAFLNAMPAPSFRITRTEMGLRLSHVDADGSAQDSRCDPVNAHRFLETLQATLPRRTLAERLYVLNSNWSRQCIRSCAPLSRKRRILRVLSHARVLLMLADTDHLRYMTPLIRALSSLLHEPESGVVALLKEHTFYYGYNYCRRRVHTLTLPGHAECLQEFEWPEEENYRNYVQHSSGSRVLMTIHMGDFIGAFNRIAESVADIGESAGEKRKSISLMREHIMEEGDSPHAGGLAQHRILQHGSYRTQEIVSALRGGDTTLCVLFDLRSDFGETVNVRFFGQPCSLVKGPALLSILGRATVFPFVTFEQHGSSRIEMGAPFSPGLREEESLEDATVRVVQQLASLAEDWIRRAPAQWKFLLSLPSYLIPAGCTDD